MAAVSCRTFVNATTNQTYTIHNSTVHEMIYNAFMDVLMLTDPDQLYDIQWPERA